MLLPTLDNQVGILIDDRLNSKESKYFWHISISFYSDSAKIGIIFDTNNFFQQEISSFAKNMSVQTKILVF